jgi:hypothetical protein
MKVDQKHGSNPDHLLMFGTVCLRPLPTIIVGLIRSLDRDYMHDCPYIINTVPPSTTRQERHDSTDRTCLRVTGYGSEFLFIFPSRARTYLSTARPSSPQLFFRRFGHTGLGLGYNGNGQMHLAS